jgi:hypothetical protein
MADNGRRQPALPYDLGARLARGREGRAGRKRGTVGFRRVQYLSTL